MVLIFVGPFEKFTQVTMILPLTGQQYSEKVTENCVAIWKSVGIYTEEEGKAAGKFCEVFKEEKFPPGHSVLFTQSPLGSLTVRSQLFLSLQHAFRFSYFFIFIFIFIYIGKGWRPNGQINSRLE